MTGSFAPRQYIDEQIEVLFGTPPALEKKPPCPNGFVWRGNDYRIAELLSAWHDYRRRGRAARNMRPSHAALAAGRGSWGVGRDYFRVRTLENRIFELYFDRAPQGSDHRKGHWILLRELSET